MSKFKKEGVGDFDTSDSPREPMPKKPAGPPKQVPVRRDPQMANRGHAYNPGMPPRKTEAPRPRSQTSQFQVSHDTPFQKSSAPNPATQSGEDVWDVYVNGGGVYKVPAPDEQTAKMRAHEFLTGGGDPDYQGKSFPISAFQAVRGEGTTGGDIAGYQEPVDEEFIARLKEAIRPMVREIVRKKEGGGGYNLYPPNKGKKKKNQKPVGTFPTRIAAKRVELARFPPKDPEQLKKLRKRMDKLAKDPKKRAEAEKKDLTGAKGPKKSGAPKSDRKKAQKEAFVRSMVQSLRERLFHEDEVPGSHWDEHVSAMKPEVVSSDKKLHNLHKGLQVASIGALRDAHKAMIKALKGQAKVNPGDAAFDPERKKMFMPVMLDVDGAEVGPVHLYVDGGHVKIEVSDQARQAISELDPPKARDIRGGLMSFQEDHLPQIDSARKAWNERDSYLDKVHGKLEKHFGGMTDVEKHLAKRFLTKGGKK